MNKQFLFVVLLVLILLVRIQQVWPLDKSGNPEFEEITIQFEPILDQFSEISSQLLPQPQAALLMGMVLGVKADMPGEFKNALRRTSTIHMVVVSGQNLTLLSGFFLSFATVLGRKKTILLTLGVVLFYSILTGLQVPVLRAAIMVFFASVAQILGKDRESPWILVITALGMLIYNPNWLYSISFQLSFLATIGVVIVAPEVIKSLRFLPNIIKQDFGMSLAAQAMVFPIIALNFHQASIVGLFANAFLLWTVPIIMISGAVALLVSLINVSLGWVLALIPGIFLTYFVYIVNFFNSLPLASVYVGKISPLVWIGYYITILGLYLYLRKSNYEET